MSSTKNPCLVSEIRRASNSSPRCWAMNATFFRFDQFALGILGAPLGFRGLERQGVQFIGTDGRPGGPLLFDDAKAWECGRRCLNLRVRLSSAGSRSPCAWPSSAGRSSFQNAMHNQVRIAPDGRGEMCVGARRQREVAQVLFRVARLLQRAQHEVGKDALLRLALQALGQPLVMPRRDFQVDRFPAARGAAGVARDHRAR